MALAKICWLQSEDSGRERPFIGEQYIAVARFEKEKSKWPGEAWSLVVEFNEPSPTGECATAKIHFLAPSAPAYLLNKGDKFELFEGSKCVAEGEVLSDTREIAESLKA